MVPRRKPTRERLDALGVDVGALRTKIAAVEQIVGLKDHPGWQAVRGLIAEKIKATERYFDTFETMTPEQRVIFLKERKDLRYFHGIVEDFEANLPDLQRALAEAIQTHDDYKRRISTAST